MEQEIILTTKVRDNLNKILSDENISRVLMVCDAAFEYLKTKDEYLELNAQLVVYNQFSSNPKYEDVVKGVQTFRENKCEAIIAVGGGSSIDVAKCIKLYSEMDDSKLYLEQEYRDNNVVLIAIPTTSGTGSESTRYAVIYYDGKKQSVTHESIIPHYAILDYRNLMTLPLYQKKCTMADALCQSIEAWWSINSTDEAIEYAKKAITLIMYNMEDYLSNKNSGNVAMLTAANYAGRAINISQTTAAHAMSYKLTSLYNIPHGRAVLMCLPHIWRLMDELQIEQEKFAEIAYILGYASVKDAIDYIIKLNDMLFANEPVSLNSNDIELLVQSVNPTRIKNNPLPLTEDMLRQLYQQIISRADNR